MCTAVHVHHVCVCVFDHLGFIGPLVFITSCCIIFGVSQMCVHIGSSQGVLIRSCHLYMSVVVSYPDPRNDCRSFGSEYQSVAVCLVPRPSFAAIDYGSARLRRHGRLRLDKWLRYRNSLRDHQFYYSRISLTMPVFRAIVSYVSNYIRRKDAMYENTQP